MKTNPGKCRLLLSNKSPEVVSTDGIQITSSTAETLYHISPICNKVTRKN